MGFSGLWPAALGEVPQACRGAFGTPTFATFTALVNGMLGATGPRTVTGMWVAAGLAGRVHWSRAHRFFSDACWDTDTLGLLLARAVVTAFVPSGAALTVAVDDTLFHRFGKNVFVAAWQHDGSAKGRDRIGRGNCFVIARLVVTVPFLHRSGYWSVLLLLHIPNSKKKPNPDVTVSKTEAARALLNLLTRAFPERHIHLVADAPYRSPASQNLPANTTFSTRLASNAVLFDVPPPPGGRRGHLAWQGKRMGTAAELATTATFTETTVTCYSEVDTVHIAVIDRLWWGSLHRTPVHVVLVKDPDCPQP